MRYLRVGLLSAGFGAWGGGRDFLRLLASGLARSGAHVILLIPRDTVAFTLRKKAVVCRDALRTLRRFELPKFPWIQKDDPSQVVEAVSNSGCEFVVVEYPNSRAGLARALEKHGIDIALPCFKSLGSDFPRRWLGYLYDLQHKYLPELFSPQMIASRDREFQSMLREARAVIVNAQQVKDDLERFFEKGACKITALPFSAIPQPEWLIIDVECVKSRYEIRTPYFIISNQFWLHKDHATAFKALARVAKQDAQLICTGSTSDFRDPEYFSRLQRLIVDLSLSERIRILGHIPKSDQIAMMRGAVAVLQPTLFEGGPGGGSVYDAVAVGTPAIISDIPVNREIVEEGVEFFHVGSAEHLAEVMTAILRVPRERASNQQLLERGATRQNRLADALARAIESAL